MMKVLVSAFCLMLLSGCLSSKHMRAREIQTDLAIREMRSELGDQKYQISRLEVELEIVEGKSDTQNNVIQNLRQELQRLNKNEDHLIKNTLNQYEEQLKRVTSMESSLKKDLLKLKDHTEEVQTTLVQFKSKIDQNERDISVQSRYVDHLKDSLETLLKYVDQSNLGSVFYVVQAGDSLDRIAKENGVSIVEIKKLNHLYSDLIIIGQKLRLK
jgi:LysM repeat protein